MTMTQGDCTDAAANAVPEAQPEGTESAPVVVAVPARYAFAGHPAVVLPDSEHGNGYDGFTVVLRLIGKRTRDSGEIRVRVVDLDGGERRAISAEKKFSAHTP